MTNKINMNVKVTKSVKSLLERSRGPENLSFYKRAKHKIFTSSSL